jgi:predicted RNA-binding Zn ribbon-like protein
MVIAIEATDSGGGVGFSLFGGRPSLNFIATLGKRHSVPVERLPDGAAFARWLVEAEVLPTRAQVGPLTPEQLESVRELREVIERLVRATMERRRPAAADVARINEVAARPDLAPQLLRGTKAESTRRGLGDVVGDPVDAALSVIARDTILLLTHPRAFRIKECEHPDCSLLFFDDSQSGRRRWCSMDRCGNLAKIAGYRSRVRSGAAEAH